MKATRKYIATITKGLRAWEHWVNEGNSIISEHEELFPHMIEKETIIIRKLKSSEIEDEILASEDGMTLRIKRANDMLDDVVQRISETQGTKAELTDAEVNTLLDKFREAIEDKVSRLLKVISTCEKYANIEPQQTREKKPQQTRRNKQPTKWWKDGKLEEAQKKFKGQRGRPVARAIMNMVYDPGLPLPSFREFSEKFPEAVDRASFYKIRNDFEPRPQITKLR